MDSVNVLGIDYKIVTRSKEKDHTLKDGNDGYCDYSTKSIIIVDLDSLEDWSEESKEARDYYERSLLRHEIVHAFLYESGLDICTNSCENGWARSEEIVDWIALQGKKIYEAWNKAGCI